MKNIQSFDNFINESQEDLYSVDDYVIESEIDEELNSIVFEQSEIEELNFIIEHLNEIVGDIDSILFEADSTDKEIEYARRSGARSTGKKVANAIGWLAFPHISILRAIYKTVAKKAAIRKLVKKETDPHKKEKLRNELKAMTRKQVSAYAELQKLKEKKKKAEEKATDKVKDIPADKREAIVKQAEKQKADAAKLRDQIEKAKSSK